MQVSARMLDCRMLDWQQGAESSTVWGWILYVQWFGALRIKKWMHWFQRRQDRGFGPVSNSHNRAFSPNLLVEDSVFEHSARNLHACYTIFQRLRTSTSVLDPWSWNNDKPTPAPFLASPGYMSGSGTVRPNQVCRLLNLFISIFETFSFLFFITLLSEWTL